MRNAERTFVLSGTRRQPSVIATALLPDFVSSATFPMVALRLSIRTLAHSHEFFLRLSPRSRARECHVVWRSKDGLGVKFIDEPKGLSKAAQERTGSLVGVDQS